jgi:hypothetical protein
MEKNFDKVVSLQRWLKLHKSVDPDKFVLLGKNLKIRTDVQTLQKFHKIYSLIY